MKNSGIHEWDLVGNISFPELKRKLTESPIMRPPAWQNLLLCHMDGCQVSVGGTLTQLDDTGEENSIAYFSKRLSLAEETYSVNDRELLGLIYFLQHFRCYLEGSKFAVLTDNQVLRSFFSKASLDCFETRWLAFLGQFGITKL